MLEDVLPQRLCSAINCINYKSLCELRIRVDNPIVVNCLGVNYYLGECGVVEDKNSALSIGDGVMQSIIRNISKNSLYSVNDQIVDGYLAYDGGIRIGICGEVVVVNGIIKTIKNISSINFRFPHMVKNCSLGLFNYIVNSNGELNNTLILSPPGGGKTTILRDIIFQITNRCGIINVLVVDERQELSQVYNGNDIVKLENIDVYTNCTKKFAFNNGIRSMKPDVIVTDEINIDRDIDDIENALTCGVKVIASIHASNIYELKSKNKMKSIIDKGLFDRYVVLSSSNGVGNIDGIYNQNFKLLGV